MVGRSIPARRCTAPARRSSVRQGTRVAWLTEARDDVELCRERRDDLRRRQGDRMTQVVLRHQARRRLHRRQLLRRRRRPRGVPLDAGQPAGVPRPQRVGRRRQLSVGARRRTQPGVVLQHRRHPAGHPGHAVHDRHGRSRTCVAAQARQLRLHPQARDGQGAVDRHAVRHADRLGLRTRGMRLRPRHRRPAADGGDRRHARRAARGARHAAEVVRRPGHRPELAHRRD